MRARFVFPLMVVLALVAGCSSDDGEEPDATSSTPTTVGATSTVAETTSTMVVADEAQIEISYTEDGTAYAGDREIIEGTLTVTFSNETDNEAIVGLLRYETGSDALAEELEVIQEGHRSVTADPPTEGYVEVNLEGSSVLAPGSHTWTVDLEPGTYLFDVGPLDFHITGLWRAAVFEVVGK